jgi:hypothetical protein
MHPVVRQRLANNKSVAAAAALKGLQENLQGVGLIPPLAGRLPTYILRQLLAFKTGARGCDWAAHAGGSREAADRQRD